MKHVPVLKREVLEVFADCDLHTFFDGTLGAGGHAEALLQSHPEIERYIASDRDPKAIELAKRILEPYGEKLEIKRGSYAERIREVDASLNGFFIDIGVSSMQLDEDSRGFSFRVDAPLDMRMDPDEKLTAKEIVNRYSEKDLAQIFYEFGEERKSRKCARAICEARKKKRIETTQDLVEIIKPFAWRGKLHFATLIFQALRIAVNDELVQLRRGLIRAIEKVQSKGRIVVISFHSLEDRIAKQVFRENRKSLRILTQKPLVAKREEIWKNPRARSAKLRAAEVL